MQVGSTGLIGEILALLGNRHNGLQLLAGGLVLQSKQPREIAFDQLAGPLDLRRGKYFSTVQIPLRAEAIQQVKGLPHLQAAAFVAAANLAWANHYLHRFDAFKPEITRLAEVATRLMAPRRYPAACLVQPFLQDVIALLDRVPETPPANVLDASLLDKLALLVKFRRDPVASRQSAIDSFVSRQIVTMADFFDRIETMPLTTEQRHAVIADEDATLVLAGAGSGKTSVITAKAAYLINQNLRAPDEILLMAFAKDAADEMSRRIRARAGYNVTAKTFHALAYGILAQVEGTAPPLAAHASDDGQFIVLLRDILKNQIAAAGETGGLIMRWFSEFFWPYRSEWDFNTYRDYNAYVREHELRTMRGEKVRSFEELEIANWLCLNGIAYDYEPVYEHVLPDTGRKEYTPDFRLRDSGIYIEHFGVRKEQGTDGQERLITAPYVDREKYLAGMDWKRKIHAEYGTILIETFSYEKLEGRLTQALAEKLRPRTALRPMPAEQALDRLSKLGQIDSFTQTLATFLRHFKGAGGSVAQIP